MDYNKQIKWYYLSGAEKNVAVTFQAFVNSETKTEWATGRERQKAPSVKGNLFLFVFFFIVFFFFFFFFLPNF